MNKNNMKDTDPTKLVERGTLVTNAMIFIVMIVLMLYMVI